MMVSAKLCQIDLTLKSMNETPNYVHSTEHLLFFFFFGEALIA